MPSPSPSRGSGGDEEEEEEEEEEKSDCDVRAEDAVEGSMARKRGWWWKEPEACVPETVTPSLLMCKD